VAIVAASRAARCRSRVLKLEGANAPVMPLVTGPSRSAWLPRYAAV
jgi:hypothetical protein